MKNPLLLALSAHLLALLGIWLLANHLPALLPTVPLARLILQGSMAAMFGRLLGLPYWWLPINLLLPALFVLMLDLALPPWLYLLGFALLLLLQWNSSHERVPLYLSNRTTWQALDGLLASYRPTRFIDLGSGLAGSLFYLARRHPECQFVGIESAPLPYALARLRLYLTQQHNIELRYGSLWDCDLRDYSMIYAFLSPAPMARLGKKLQDEQTGEQRFISNSFPLPETAASEVLELSDRRQTRLYLYEGSQ